MTRVFMFSLFICMSQSSQAEQNLPIRIAFGVGVLATMGASIAAAALSDETSKVLLVIAPFMLVPAIGCMSRSNEKGTIAMTFASFGVSVAATVLNFINLKDSVMAAAFSLAGSIGYPLLFLGYLYLKKVETSSETFCPC